MVKFVKFKAEFDPAYYADALRLAEKFKAVCAPGTGDYTIEESGKAELCLLLNLDVNDAEKIMEAMGRSLSVVFFRSPTDDCGIPITYFVPELPLE